MNGTKSLGLMFVIAVGGVALAPRIFPTEVIVSKSIAKQVQTELGSLKNLSGTVYTKSPLQSDRQEALATQTIHPLTTIWVEESSSVDLVFKNGTTLELDPNTRINLEEKKVSPSKTTLVLNIIYGGYAVAELQEGLDIEVADRGRIYSLNDHLALKNQDQRRIEIAKPIAKSTEIKKTVASYTESLTTALNKSDISSTSNTLSDDEIFDTVATKKSMFKRCYMQHLQTHPEAKGKMDLSFVIHPTGGIDQLQIQNSSIDDVTFKQCIRTAMLRCKFRSFKSAAIMAQYPLSFE